MLLSSAAQATVIYLTDGDSATVYQVDLDTGTYTSWSTYALAYPIAITDTIRLGDRENGPVGSTT